MQTVFEVLYPLGILAALAVIAAAAWRAASAAKAKNEAVTDILEEALSVWDEAKAKRRLEEDREKNRNESVKLATKFVLACAKSSLNGRGGAGWMFNPEGQWRAVYDDGEEMACFFEWNNISGQRVELRVNAEWGYAIELRGMEFLAWLKAKGDPLAAKLEDDDTDPYIAPIRYDANAYAEKLAKFLVENPMGYYPPDPNLEKSQRLCGEFQDELHKLLSDGEPTGWQISAGDTDVNFWNGELDLSVQFDAAVDLPLRVIGCEIVPGHKDHFSQDADAWDGSQCHKDLPASELQNVASAVASFLAASAQKAAEIPPTTLEQPLEDAAREAPATNEYFASGEAPPVDENAFDETVIDLEEETAATSTTGATDNN